MFSAKDPRLVLFWPTLAWTQIRLCNQVLSPIIVVCFIIGLTATISFVRVKAVLWRSLDRKRPDATDPILTKEAVMNEQTSLREVVDLLQECLLLVLELRRVCTELLGMPRSWRWVC